MDKRVLQIIGIVAIIIIAINIVFLIFNANSVKAVLTGRVSQGEVNITIGEYIALNFTTWQMDWGVGSVDAGEDNATLCSYQTAQCPSDDCEAEDNPNWPYVCRGNWSPSYEPRPLVIENQGNVNLSVGFSIDEDSDSAADFIGGTNPQFQWLFDETAESCFAYHSGTEYLTWYDVNATRGVCDNLHAADGQDDLKIAFHIVVPSDSKTGGRGGQITAVVSASA